MLYVVSMQASECSTSLPSGERAARRRRMALVSLRPPANFPHAELPSSWCFHTYHCPSLMGEARQCNHNSSGNATIPARGHGIRAFVRSLRDRFPAHGGGARPAAGTSLRHGLPAVTGAVSLPVPRQHPAPQPRLKLRHLHLGRGAGGGLPPRPELGPPRAPQPRPSSRRGRRCQRCHGRCGSHDTGLKLDYPSPMRRGVDTW